MTTSKIDDGGPAFPRDHAADGHNGMALRDYFAAKALQGMLAGHFAHYGHENYWAPKDAASTAIEYADAMIAARKEAS